VVNDDKVAEAGEGQADEAVPEWIGYTTVSASAAISTLDLDCTIDFERPEVAKQRARLAGEAVRLVLKGADAVVNPTRFGLCTGAVNGLGAERNHHDAHERVRGVMSENGERIIPCV